MKQFLTLVIVLLIAGAVYYYLQLDTTQETQNVTVEPLLPPVEVAPEILHPINEDSTTVSDSIEEKQTAAETEEPLPPLEESDSKIKEILSGIIGNDLVNKFFRETGIIHRFVVTVDSLPKKEVPLRYRLLPPTSGTFLVHTDDSDKMTLDPENYRRYNTAIQLLDKLDTEQFVKWYKRFYPLIQEDYDSLGYKDGYFNDRFIFVIDHLLVIPEVIGAIELVQPKVFYNFADPALQNFSAGQKILVRIGPANTAIVKAKLNEIRRKLAAPQPDE